MHWGLSVAKDTKGVGVNVRHCVAQPRSPVFAVSKTGASISAAPTGAGGYTRSGAEPELSATAFLALGYRLAALLAAPPIPSFWTGLQGRLSSRTLTVSWVVSRATCTSGLNVYCQRL